MHVELGWTYSFKFTKDFETLNNVYTVVKIYSYDEFINDNLDLYTLLYSRVAKSYESLEVDVQDYRTQQIFKLRNPDNYDDILYVPEGIIAEVPNFNVKKYAKLVISLNVGVYPNEEELAYAVNSMQEYLQVILGFANNPLITAIRHVWLTDEEYQNTIGDREKNKEVVNYYSKCLELEKEITRQKGTIERFNTLFDAITSGKDVVINVDTRNDYIQVDTEAIRLDLTENQIKVGDFVEVRETRRVYKVVSTNTTPDPNTGLLDKNTWFSIYDISDPTLIQVTTEANKYDLTTSEVQENDRVLVDDTKTLYRVIDTNNLSNSSGYAIELTEPSKTDTPRLFTVETDKDRFALTKRTVSVNDYVLVNSTKCLYQVISTAYLDLEYSYTLILKHTDTEASIVNK